MKKVLVKNNVNNRQFQSFFETQEEAQSWIDHHVKNNSWGKPERVVLQEVCSEEQLATALELIPEEQVEVASAVEAQFDEDGNENSPAIEAIIETTPAMVKLPCDYEITIEDITDQVEQAKINKESLKFLADSDWKVLRHIRQKALGEPTTLTEQEYLALEQQRADAASRVIR